VAFFGPFSGYGTAGLQGTEVASDAELIVRNEFTLNPSSILDLLKTVGFFRKSLFCNARFPKTLVV
jgi:hypothetical protein